MFSSDMRGRAIKKINGQKLNELNQNNLDLVPYETFPYGISDVRGPQSVFLNTFIGTLDLYAL